MKYLQKKMLNNLGLIVNGFVRFQWRCSSIQLQLAVSTPTWSRQDIRWAEHCEADPCLSSRWFPFHLIQSSAWHYVCNLWSSLALLVFDSVLILYWRETVFGISKTQSVRIFGQVMSFLSRIVCACLISKHRVDKNNIRQNIWDLASA